MIEFLTNGRLLEVLANLIMVIMLIGLNATIVVLFVIGLRGIWRLF